MELTLIEWTLAGAFLLVVLLAIAVLTFVRGILALRKAEELAPLNATVENLKAEIAACETKLNAQLGTWAKAQQDIARGEEARSFIEAHAGEIAGMREQEEILKVRVREAQERFNEETGRLQELQNTLNERNAELGKVDAALSAKQNQYEWLKLQIVSLEGNRKALNEEIAKAAARLKELQKEVAQLESLRNEVERLRQERRHLEGQLADLDEKLRKIKIDMANAQGKLEGYTRTIAEHTAQTGKPEEVWKDLREPVREPIARKPLPETFSEETWLAGFDELLKTHGFTFPARTLRAFHTGLKCGDATPLVVLAGISGTGKSLLPELYAAAAGMNFLSVPVQPRWDGPQDLLGFYNYMERRYKATELARFLWQADWAHNQGGAGAFPKDALNIVLLDEMNLARVEYYFADFLSRLEQRRGLDLENAANWEKASLTLECGSGLGNQPLLLTRNTFLVGTMNEDETTQMLSDKVIDRSNVLRFGQPAKLESAPRKERFLRACKGWGRVSRAVWGKWSREAAEDLGYRETLGALNDALAGVGRPFAYRVQQAVDAYMANYPIRGTDGLRAAFADQIEMKVLPKLNGLELSTPGWDEARGTIAAIIDKQEDAALGEAFARACASDNTFFRWRGVTRAE